ncbi:single-stranded DNA-binding protein [Agromyces laixinhei]|uniref:single-stranded DNA-binding protein n=1 Tax=Agromyces laixinhei TaxID=2585717 RepID=UPI00111688E5|nr:single-stranded DNA-binding protein [Agromyces laixinhei]
MTDNITVTGVVGTDPKHHVTNGGLAITSFRLASTRRVFDREKGTWEDGETNWYTISSFRQLAVNASLSIRKGERLMVRGRLRLRAWETGERSGTAVEIEADSIGHDLAWCVSTYSKVRSTRAADGTAAESSPGEPADGLESTAEGADPATVDGSSPWATADVVVEAAGDEDDLEVPELEASFAR